MILKRVHVRNFRAIRDEIVDLGPHTAILGGNGAGKSTLLRAIDRFYAPSTAVEGDDFFGRRLDQPIEIALTFTSFNADELERFASRIENDEMTVTRVFEAGGGRSNGRYFGATRQHPEFTAIRAIDGARDQRGRFNEVAAQFGLEPAANAAQVNERMGAWEAAHPDDCLLARDEGAFFGFQNVGRGNLQKSTSFVFIPAVRDAAVDSTDARGGAIQRLMELVVRSAVQQRAEVRDFQREVTERYRELVDPERLPELNGLAGDLTTTLKEFYADAQVALKWQPAGEFSIPLPAADVLLEEDGFEGPVDRKGHGLQRAFIVTLLQHLARATSADAQAGEDHAEPDGPADAAEGDIPVEPRREDPYVLPGLILAIEEPELYQHPTKQRHLANVLKKLSDGRLPGVAARTQVMFASHSPLFVSLDRFDEVRVARRVPTEGGDERECRLSKSTLQEIVGRLQAAHGAPDGAYNPEALRSRLHVIGPELAEGFFADLAVLVEGVSDRAAIMAAAAVMGVDFEAAGVAVLNAEGKTKLDKPAAIFEALGIPTYVIFDCDDGDAGEVPHNRALERLMGEDALFDAETRVTANYACFAQKAEHQVRLDLGAAVFDAQLQAAQEKYAIKRKDVLKTPLAMTEVLREAARLEHRSQTLEAIVAAIMAKRAA